MRRPVRNRITNKLEPRLAPTTMTSENNPIGARLASNGRRHLKVAISPMVAATHMPPTVRIT
jgi:hypothetical protein